MIRTSLIDGANIEHDKDYTVFGSIAVTPGIIEGLKVVDGKVEI